MRKDIFITFVIFCFIIFVWASFSGVYGSIFSPGPFLVFQRIIDIAVSSNFRDDFFSTISRVIMGSLLTSVFSTVLLIIYFIFYASRHVLRYLTLFGLVIPGLVWSVVSVAVLGSNELAALLAICGVAVPFVFNIQRGSIEESRKDIEKLALLYQIPRKTIFRKVIFPPVLSSTRAAIRASFALSWKIVIIIETFGFGSGIGVRISRAFAVYDIRDILAITLAFIIVMLVFELVLSKIFRPTVQRYVG